MCVVSMMGDYYRDTWPKRWPEVFPIPSQPSVIHIDGISKQEFEQLKREVQEMKELLIAAKRYDEEHDEPDCEMDEKIEILKRIAEAFDVDLAEVFG